MKEEKLFLKWDSHHTTFNHVISRLRCKEFYTDVTLACNGKLYPLHKLVLSICSDYFREIFEINECSNTMIILTDIQCSDIELLLDYMYTGEVNVKNYDMASLLRTAEFLRIKSLSSHYKGSKNSSCSNTPDIFSSLKSRSDGDISTYLSSRGCDPPVKNIENVECSNELSVENKFHKDNLGKGCGIKDQLIKGEGEDVSETHNVSDVLQTVFEDDPLSTSECNTSNLDGISGIANYTNSFLGRVVSEFTENLSGVVTAHIPPSKRRKIDEDSYTDCVIPSNSCTSSLEDPKCPENIPGAPIESVISGIEHTNPSLVEDYSGFTESLYVAVSKKHTVLSLAMPQAPIEPLIEFFREKGVLQRKVFCDHCKISMKFCKDNRVDHDKRSPDGYIWKCYYEECTKRYAPKSIRENSIFHKSKITLKQWLHMLHQYTSGTGIANAAHIIGLSRQSVSKAYKLLRRYFSEQFETNTSNVSDPGISVKIEESLPMKTFPE